MTKYSIKELRLKHGYSLRDLSSRTKDFEKVSGIKGIGVKALHQMERGFTQPRPSTLRILSQVFGVSVEDIGT